LFSFHTDAPDATVRACRYTRTGHSNRDQQMWGLANRGRKSLGCSARIWVVGRRVWRGTNILVRRMPFMSKPSSMSRRENSSTASTRRRS